MLPSIGQLPVISASSTAEAGPTCVSGWLNSRSGEYSPAAGSTCSCWEKTSCRISAIQKIGIDTPRIEPARMAWSARRPGRRAETRPSGTPTASAMISAAITSSSEAGAAVHDVGQHRPVGVDRTGPSSRVTMPPK